MEKIIIKNFGPIKEVELEIKDINVFIGSTSSGKSTVAKLIGIFKSVEFFQIKDIRTFKKVLDKYNINFPIDDNTYIEYSAALSWLLNKKKVNTKHSLDQVRHTVSDAIKPLEIAVSEQPPKPISILQMYSILHLYDNLQRIHNYLKVDSIGLTEQRNGEGISILLKNIERSLQTIEDQGSSNLSNSAQEGFKLSNQLVNNIDFHSLLYIPTERILLSMVAGSIFGLMNNDVNIADCIKIFGAEFEFARGQLESLIIDFFDVKYEYEHQKNYITFNKHLKIKLEEASSGIQSVIPLLLTVEANTKLSGKIRNFIVIEEPELNLYPTIQKELVEFIVERINKSKDKLILTTHSPYVLTSLDNLIQASNAAKAHPELKEKASEIVAEAKWVDFDRMACYFFENGSCRSTLDQENQTIGTSNIDDVSEALGKTFDQLLELKYAHVS